MEVGAERVAAGRFGGIQLGDLAKGRWRALSEVETTAL